jgi:hypothetical protein
MVDYTLEENGGTEEYQSATCPVCGTLCCVPEDDGGYICENPECQFFFDREDK